MVADQRKAAEGTSGLSTEAHRAFVVDFYCPKAKLVIELDGGQHYTEEQQARDEARDRYVMTQGLRTLRFSDKEVFENLTGMLEEIWNRT